MGEQNQCGILDNEVFSQIYEEIDFVFIHLSISGSYLGPTMKIRLNNT